MDNYKLVDNIGNIVTCISYSSGVRKEVTGYLREVHDEYICIGNEKFITDIITFNRNSLIFAVYNDNGVLYLNDTIYQNQTIRKEIDKFLMEEALTKSLK